MTHPFPHLGLADRAVNESRYRLGRATAATAVPQLNIKEINLPGGGEEDEAPTRQWKLDVHAKMKNRLMVTGLGQIGRAHVCTTVTNAQLVSRLLFQQKTYNYTPPPTKKNPY